MTQTAKVRIKQIARSVRAWAEKQDSPSDLSEWCGICSYRLLKKLGKELSKKGFTSHLALSDCHAFVLIGGYIVDVTATQFGHRNKVMFAKSAHHCSDKYAWCVDTKIHWKNTQALKKEFKTWPDYQIPFEIRKRKKHAKKH